MSHFFFSWKFWYKSVFSLLDVDNYARRNEEHEFLLKISAKSVFTAGVLTNHQFSLKISAKTFFKTHLFYKIKQ